MNRRICLLLLSMLAIALSWSSNIFGSDLAQKTMDMGSAFEELCLNPSLITKIQMSRIPERRKSMYNDCIKEKWMSRYFIEIEDVNYFDSNESDASFRSGLGIVKSMPFYVSRNLITSLGAVSGFQTVTTSDKINVDDSFKLGTLKQHTTIYPIIKKGTN